MAIWLDVMTVLTSAFLFNMIPFLGPSNLFIASNAALLVKLSPVEIGLIVATGSALAKLTHYLVTFFISGHISEQRRRKLDVEAKLLRRWAFAALFVVAATPLPDEPVIIPLGLLRYNPVKFLAAYFSGKLIIGIAGAYLGSLGEQLFAPMITQEVLIVISIILTITITIILLKIDVTSVAEKMLKKKA